MTRADKAQQQALAAHAAAIRQLLTDPTLEPSHGGGAVAGAALRADGMTPEERAYRRGAYMALRLAAKMTRAGSDEVRRVGVAILRAIDRKLSAREHRRA